MNSLESRSAAGLLDAASEGLSEKLLAHSRLLFALASSSQFVSPPDAGLDEYRFRRVNNTLVERALTYEGVGSFLPVEGGKVAAPLTSIPRNAFVWQVYRGLPLRTLNGQLLARARRLLAARVRSSASDIVSIAELDSEGRVVFLVPYEKQLALSGSDLRSVAALFEGVARDANIRVFNHDQNGWPEGTTSLVHRFFRDDGPRYLMTTLRTPIVASGVSWRTTPRLLTSTNSSRSVEVLGRTWFSDAAPPESTAFYAAVRLFGIAIIPVAGSVLLLGWLHLRLATWTQNILDQLRRVRRDVSKASQDLAHDYHKSMLALRTLSGHLSTSLALEQHRRLDGIVTDLSGYTEYLGTRFSQDAVPYPGESKHGDAERKSRATYARGILETLTQHQAGLLGRSIPVRVDASTSEPFVIISRVDLTRIVGNLLSNAVEACTGRDDATIVVSAWEHGDSVVIRVTDTGAGVSPQVAASLFDPGFSTKGGGRGTGLSTARELSRKWAGDLVLVESSGETSFELSLPRAQTPVWFANRVPLSGKSVLVVVDDEPEVFQYWIKTLSERFRGITLPPGHTPRLISVSSPEALRANEQAALTDGTVFLVDHVFRGSDTDGLDLIVEHGLQEKAFLVTNHFDQEDLLNRAVTLGIRIIPKVYLLNTKFPLDLRIDE